MTMFPAHRQNLRKKESFAGVGGYGGTCGGGRRYFEGDYDDCFISLGGGSDLMAEDESRTEISNNNEETQGSSSKDIHQEINKDEDGGWLQLSLGSGHVPSTSHYQHRPSDQISLGPRLVELDLLPGGSGSSSGGGESSSSQQLMMRPLTLTAPPPQQQQLSFQVPDFRGPFLTTAAPPTTITSLFLQPQHRAAGTTIDSVPAAMTYTHQYDYLPFRPYPQSMTTSTTVLNPPLSSSPSFSGSLEQVPGSGSGSYHGRPLHFHSGSLDVTAGPAARMDIRVVDPPRRPHSGVWFMLQASQNQTKEPYLPQVPKSYLRIRDGRTSTVGLLIKYLVNKLKLDSEFEIEITCKGQQLLPFMTLHHVRDNIWHNPRSDAVFSRTSTNIDDHLMVLKYGRIA